MAALASSTIAPPANSAAASSSPLPPLLLLFASSRSGEARRVEGYVAHVLQRRHNHGSFRFRIVMQEERPDIFERLHVTDVPTLIVVDNQRVVRRISGYARPPEVESGLRPWLR